MCDQNNNSDRDVCSHYMKGKCNFGARCFKYHPPLARPGDAQRSPQQLHQQQKVSQLYRPPTRATAAAPHSGTAAATLAAGNPPPPTPQRPRQPFVSVAHKNGPSGEEVEVSLGTPAPIDAEVYVRVRADAPSRSHVNGRSRTMDINAPLYRAMAAAGLADTVRIEHKLLESFTAGVVDAFKKGVGKLSDCPTHRPDAVRTSNDAIPRGVVCSFDGRETWRRDDCIEVFWLDEAVNAGGKALTRNGRTLRLCAKIHAVDASLRYPLGSPQDLAARQTQKNIDFITRGYVGMLPTAENIKDHVNTTFLQSGARAPADGSMFTGFSETDGSTLQQYPMTGSDWAALCEQFNDKKIKSFERQMYFSTSKALPSISAVLHFEVDLINNKLTRIDDECRFIFTEVKIDCAHNQDPNCAAAQAIHALDCLTFSDLADDAKIYDAYKAAGLHKLTSTSTSTSASTNETKVEKEEPLVPFAQWKAMDKYLHGNASAADARMCLEVLKAKLLSRLVANYIGAERDAVERAADASIMRGRASTAAVPGVAAALLAFDSVPRTVRSDRHKMRDKLKYIWGHQPVVEIKRTFKSTRDVEGYNFLNLYTWFANERLCEHPVLRRLMFVSIDSDAEEAASAFRPSTDPAEEESYAAARRGIEWASGGAVSVAQLEVLRDGGLLGNRRLIQTYKEIIGQTMDIRTTESNTVRTALLSATTRLCVAGIDHSSRGADVSCCFGVSQWASGCGGLSHPGRSYDALMAQRVLAALIADEAAAKVTVAKAVPAEALLTKGAWSHGKLGAAAQGLPAGHECSPLAAVGYEQLIDELANTSATAAAAGISALPPPSRAACAVVPTADAFPALTAEIFEGVGNGSLAAYLASMEVIRFCKQRNKMLGKSETLLKHLVLMEEGQCEMATRGVITSIGTANDGTAGGQRGGVPPIWVSLPHYLTTTSLPFWAVKGARIPLIDQPSPHTAATQPCNVAIGRGALFQRVPLSGWPEGVPLPPLGASISVWVRYDVASGSYAARCGEDRVVATSASTP